MCFSAEASFAASAVLIPAGVYTLRTAWRSDRAFLGFASFPLLFGLQQALEGVLWRAIDRGQPDDTYLPAIGFLFFAYLVWPVLVPLSAWLIESKKQPSALFMGCTTLGLLLGVSLFVPLVLAPGTVDVKLARHSILYDPQLIWDGILSRTFVRVVYAAIICAPLVMSSNAHIRIFGILITVSVIGGFLFAAYAFTSIWCFVAAIISIYIVIVIRHVAFGKMANAQ